MVGIVVVTRRQGIKSASEAVNGRLEAEIVIIRKDDVEVSIKLTGGKSTHMFGDKCEAYQVCLGTLSLTRYGISPA